MFRELFIISIILIIATLSACGQRNTTENENTTEIEKINITEDENMNEPAIITYQMQHGEFLFLGKEYPRNHPDYGWVWDDFFGSGGMDAITPYKTTDETKKYWMMSIHHNMDAEQEMFYIGSIVDGVDEIPDGFVLRKFPAREYVVCTTKWVDTWDEAMRIGHGPGGEFMKTVGIPEGYERYDGPDSGIILIENENSVTEDGNRYEWWVPIKRTEELNKKQVNIESFEYIHLGKVRFIGVDGYKKSEDYFQVKERYAESMTELAALLAENVVLFDDPALMTHHNGKVWDSGETHQILGYFVKADTPVPEGYDCYDLLTEWAGYMVFGNENFDGDYFTPAYEWTRDRILSDGVGIPYPEAYWTCEIFIDGMWRSGQTGAHRFGYLFSSKMPDVNK